MLRTCRHNLSSFRDSQRNWEISSVFPKFPLNSKQIHKSEELEAIDTAGSVDSAFTTKLYSLLKKIPGRVGAHRAYIHYCNEQRKNGTPEHSLPDPETFRTTYDERLKTVTNERRTVRKRNAMKVKNHGAAVYDNSNINATGAVSALDEECGTALGDEDASLLYDRYLAELYSRKHAAAQDVFGKENCPRISGNSYTRSGSSHPGQSHLGPATMTDVARAAFRDHVLDQCRPVLSHELADFKTPYMMKRSAHKKLLQQVARNPMEQRLIDTVLNRRADLTKARVHADLPPEALEPLYAFLGHRNWSFDARTRLDQQLDSATAALDDFEKFRNTPRIKENSNPTKSKSNKASKAAKDKFQRQNAMAIEEAQNHYDDAIPDYARKYPNYANTRSNPNQSDGFISMTPRKTDYIGSMRAGKPPTRYDRYLEKKRYPTLQHAAQRLPHDPVYRAHVLRTIRILERNPKWDLKSKFEAVDTLKSVYDHMDPADEWRDKLDAAIPVDIPSKRWRTGRCKQNSYYTWRMPEKNAYYMEWFTSHDNSLLKRSKLKL